MTDGGPTETEETYQHGHHRVDRPRGDRWLRGRSHRGRQPRHPGHDRAGDHRSGRRRFRGWVGPGHRGYHRPSGGHR
ncbi:MAG: hypothetical protein EPN50_08860, partial [Chloroflexota bacterium]